ncbi:hypothetical protein BDR05DRAFT_962518 [Suillus weaverae]|nr:hypothetical protein BDR05DRAFT_962518 [Suillus weaverae]
MAGAPCKELEQRPSSGSTPSLYSGKKTPTPSQLSFWSSGSRNKNRVASSPCKELGNNTLPKDQSEYQHQTHIAFAQ